MVVSPISDKTVKVSVDINVVKTSFEKWSKPGHFSRLLSKVCLNLL